jgi:nitroreductase
VNQYLRRTYYQGQKLIMNAIELLNSRQSNPFLQTPAPNEQDLNTIITAGMRVPDHGGIKPWHFTVITEQGLTRLADVFVQARVAKKAEQSVIEKAKKMPFRAPMIIAVSTKYQVHKKVPEKEQLITAGCCVHAMQMAASALGYGAMWRTGDLVENNIVKEGLNIEKGEDIVGFLYIGTKTKELPLKPNKPYESFVSYF